MEEDYTYQQGQVKKPSIGGFICFIVGSFVIAWFFMGLLVAIPAVAIAAPIVWFRMKKSAQK